MYLTLNLHPLALLVLGCVTIVCVLARALMRRRSYQEEKEEAEKDQKVERLEAELARRNYVL